MSELVSPAGCETLHRNHGVYFLYLCSFLSQQLFGEVFVVFIEVSMTFQGLIWFYRPILTFISFCNSTLPYVSFSLSCNSPSSRPLLLYLIMYLLSKPGVDPLMSPVCFLWVCQREKDGRGEQIASKEKNPKRHMAGLLLSFRHTCLISV